MVFTSNADHPITHMEHPVDLFNATSIMRELPHSSTCPHTWASESGKLSIPARSAPAFLSV